ICLEVCARWISQPMDRLNRRAARVMRRRLSITRWRTRRSFWALVCLVWLAAVMPQAAHVDAEASRQMRAGAIVNVVVELDAAPVVQVYLAQQASEVSAAAVTTATQAHLAEVEIQQRALLQTLETQDVEF